MVEAEGGQGRLPRGDDWHGYVQRLAGWTAAAGTAGPLGPAGPLPALPPALAGTVRTRAVLVCAPHPDDEAICGLLPLRLRREASCRVTALAMTLGSDPGRRAARWQEFLASCRVLGFAAQSLAPLDADPVQWRIGRHTARRHPGRWQAMAARLLELFATIRPALVLLPHRGDGHPTHVGVARLARQALRQWSLQGCDVLAAESECWVPMRRPNCVVGGGTAEVALLCRAIACHGGEVSRVPYHHRQPVRMLETAWRTAELVAGFGGRPWPFPFAEAYRVGRWRNGRWLPLPCHEPCGRGRSRRGPAGAW